MPDHVTIPLLLWSTMILTKPLSCLTSYLTFPARLPEGTKETMIS